MAAGDCVAGDGSQAGEIGMMEIARPELLWGNRIAAGAIDADFVTIGYGVVIEEGAQIRARSVTIGDFAYIGRNVRIFVPELEIGDYTRINEGSFFGGTKPLKIGNNCYVGREVQMDSRGGLTIGDNVGIGSLSQVWTHIRHGDTVQGCRWDKEYPLVIGDDVWLVARVTVGGAQEIGARAMVFNESNVTRDLAGGRAYRGNPAKDCTEATGPQFEDLSDDQKIINMNAEILRFENEHPSLAGKLWVTLYEIDADMLDGDVSWFDPIKRRYTKKYGAAEVAFLKWTLAKFTPYEGL